MLTTSELVSNGGGDTPEPAPWCQRLAALTEAELREVSPPLDRTKLRSRCDRLVTGLLRQVPLPNPWSIDSFLDRLEHWRGRDIDLCAVPWTVGNSTGAWRRKADYDIIAYPQNTAPVHQDHIILHEVGHMLAEHRGKCVLSLAEAQQLAPHLSGPAFARLLDRVNVQAEEAEAETIATMILARIARQERRSTPPRLDDPTAATLTRLTSAFDREDRP